MDSVDRDRIQAKFYTDALVLLREIRDELAKTAVPVREQPVAVTIKGFTEDFRIGHALVETYFNSKGKTYTETCEEITCTARRLLAPRLTEEVSDGQTASS